MSDFYPNRVVVGSYVFELDRYSHWTRKPLGVYQRSIAPTWCEIDMIEEIIELRREVEYLRFGRKF